MNVYLIRHGQTHGNANRIVQGWTDVDLTDLGMEQAAKAKQLLSGIDFELIFSSDLQRTKTTSYIIFGNDADIIYDQRIREINNTVFAGRRSSELKKVYGKDYFYAATHLDYGKLGGESSESILSRTKEFLYYLAGRCKAEGLQDKNIAVVTHGGVIHAIISNLMKAEINTKILAIENCSVTLLSFDEKDSIEWRIKKINYTGLLDHNAEDIPY